MKRSHGRTTQGFTIIELMVVIAIIVLLVGILMPSLSAARDNAKAVVCMTNLRHVSLAMSNYLFHSNAAYPASYVYPRDEWGSWTPTGQPGSPQYGYLHWSHFLYDDGQVGDEAFQCPKFENGGAPRTFPGPKDEDWEPGQVDGGGQVSGSPIQDKQAPRMAYTANAAIMPRNKFTTTLSGGKRVNIFARENLIKSPGKTILATEYLSNWKAIGIPQANGVLSKSHRPINPFYHIGSGFNEYLASEKAPGFIYGLPEDQEYYGLLPERDVRVKENILDHSSGLAQINAIGRHHPTTDPLYKARFGGSANFLFVDGHAAGMTVLATMQQRLWGDRYHSLSGASQILNMDPAISRP